MKILIGFIFLLLANFSICDYEAHGGVFDDKLANRIFHEMGFHLRDKISREEFKVYFYRIITKDSDKLPNQIFFEGIALKLAEEVPEYINITDVENYLEKERILHCIVEVVRQQFGEKYVDEIKEQFEKIFNEMTEKKKKLRKEVPKDDSDSENHYEMYEKVKKAKQVIDDL